MSKKIDSALKDLIKALKQHAQITGASRVSLKKSQRATAKVHSAAKAYAAAVFAKSGVASPFSDVTDPGLEASTIASLAAERDTLARAATGSIPKQSAAS